MGVTKSQLYEVMYLCLINNSELRALYATVLVSFQFWVSWFNFFLHNMGVTKTHLGSKLMLSY